VTTNGLNRRAWRALSFAMFLLFATAIGEAQTKTAKVGVLIPELGRAQSQAIKGLKNELNQLGYQERKNIIYEIRNAKRDRSAFQLLVKELVDGKVNVIFTAGTTATLAAASATLDIPIVFIHQSNPVLIGLMEGPGGTRTNLTGVAAFVEQMTERRLAVLKDIVPGTQKIHIFFDWNNRHSEKNFDRAETGAKKLGLQAVRHRIKSVEELNAAFNGLDSDEGDAIFQIPDDLVESGAERIFEVARQKKIPTMFDEEAWAIKGSLAAYGPNYFEMGRQAGRLVDKILKGHATSSLPVERAVKYDLTLNYRTARAIGLIPSREILKRANKVIR
jgi:ABC-type uncharacterized transport system substrate-binding protein